MKFVTTRFYHADISEKNIPNDVKIARKKRAKTRQKIVAVISKNRAKIFVQKKTHDKNFFAA